MHDKSMPQDAASVKWTPIEPPRGVFTKLSEGLVAEGTYHGQRTGLYGPLAVIGDVELPVKTVLGRQLGAVEVGQLVRVTVLGKKTSAAGRTFWDFKVETRAEGVRP